MRTKHARFLHIEQRREDGAPESQAADRARIAAVLGAAPTSRGADPQIEIDPDALAGDGTAHDHRVQAELPDAGDPAGSGEDADRSAGELALDLSPAAGQPFVRCATCSADSSVHATHCENCSADLDTPAQRAFNERVWEAQRRESERERAALQELAAAREEHQRSAVRPLPDPDMKPPPELLQPLHGGDGPFLLEMLHALSEPKWRWAAGLLSVALPVLLVTLGGAILSKIGWGLLLLLVLSMFPRRIGRDLLAWLSGRR